MTQLSNQFNQTNEKGAADLAQNSNVYSVRIDPNSVATLSGGSPVKVVDVAGQAITVDLATAASDDIVGFVRLISKTNTFVAGDYCTILSDNCGMFMEASAAIAKGALVEIVPTGVKVATKAAGTTIGRALNKATADGDLILVSIHAKL